MKKKLIDVFVVDENGVRCCLLMAMVPLLVVGAVGLSAGPNTNQVSRVSYSADPLECRNVEVEAMRQRKED